MTSETFIFGVPIPEKPAIGERVRRFAASLGAGHVDASVEKRQGRLVVTEAHAYPVEATAYSIRAELQRELTRTVDDIWQPMIC